MAICPYLSKMIMTNMSYSGSCIDCSSSGTNDSWELQSGTPTNEVKWATCNEDGTVTLNGVTETCELWDSTNGKCGTKVTNTLADSPNNEQNVLISMLETVVGAQSQRDNSNSLVKYFADVIGSHSEKENAPIGTSLLKTIEHVHESHRHENDHAVDEIPTDTGGDYYSPQSGGEAPYASQLVNEFVCNQDQDGNDKIYGIDFKVEDSSSKPFVLDAIEENPKFEDPETTVKWEDLLAWYQDPSSNPDPTT